MIMSKNSQDRLVGDTGTMHSSRRERGSRGREGNTRQLLHSLSTSVSSIKSCPLNLPDHSQLHQPATQVSCAIIRIHSIKQQFLRIFVYFNSGAVLPSNAAQVTTARSDTECAVVPSRCSTIIAPSSGDPRLAGLYIL